MEIRKAVLDDVEALIEIGKRGHADSENAKYDFDEGRAKLLAAQCVVANRLCAFVAVVDGKIVGFLLGQMETYPYIKMTYSTDLALYSEHPGAGRKLIERFKVWAFEERKVDQIILAVSHGGKSASHAAALYRRLGYEHVGGLFTMSRGAA